MKICVFGAASDMIDKSYISEVEKLGKYMSKRGHSLVFGAGGHGLMGAVAKGVCAEGGHITGVIPEFFKDEEIELISNVCNELIFTETMAQRKTKMEDLSDAFIVVPGGVGTFEEFFEVVTLKQLGRHTKPIVVYDINNYYEKLEEFLAVSVKEQFIREGCKELYYYTTSGEDAIYYIENDKQEKKDVHDLKFG